MQGKYFFIIPGISKAPHQECPSDHKRLQALNLTSSTLPPPPSYKAEKHKVSTKYDIKNPTDQPCETRSQRKSSSAKGLRSHEDDPFFAAYKECIKSVKNDKLPSEGKKDCGSRVWKNSFINSCKSLCDVNDDNLVKTRKLPPPPHHQVRKPDKEKL